MERATQWGSLLSLALLWYARYGQALPEVQRGRALVKAVGTTFTAMLGKLRLAIWAKRIPRGQGNRHLNPIPSKISCTASRP